MKNDNKVKNNKKKYIIIFAIISLVLIQSIYGLSKLLLKATYKKNEYVYNHSSKSMYEVYINKNEFIEQKILMSGRSYITEIVEKIGMTLIYKYNAKNIIPVNTNHSVKLTIYGQYNKETSTGKNPIIWEKEYIIKGDIVGSITKPNNEIKESFEIDIKKYNDEVEAFKKRFSIPTIAYIQIEMPVAIYNENIEYKINDNYNVSARIILYDKVFSIETEDKLVEEKKVVSSIANKTEIGTVSLIIYIILFISSLTLLLITYKKILTFRTKEEFNDHLKKLKSDYNQAIIETKNMINIKNLKPIFITTFEELLNLSSSLSVPIILYEKLNYACFYISKDDIIYTYILSEGKKTTRD